MRIFGEDLVVPVGDKFLKVEVCAPDVVRVACAKDRSFFSRPSLVVLPQHERPRCIVKRTDREATLTSGKIRVHVDLQTGAIAFLDADGKTILCERSNGRTITPAIVQGERTFHVQQQWEPNADESLYGLGQQQLGILDIKGYDLDLWQYNSHIVVPFLVSSRGYGILWDNPSYTRFGDLREFEPVPLTNLTVTYFAGTTQLLQRAAHRIWVEFPNVEPKPNTLIDPELPPRGEIMVRWDGDIEPPVSGDYLLETLSDNGVKVWIDDKLLVQRWTQAWLPITQMARVPLNAGHRHRLRVEWTRDQGGTHMRLLWKTPPKKPATSLWSEVGDGVDYYFVYGPDLDKVIAGYRHLTGAVPLMPRWAFGLWQSRQRYKTAQESLDVLEGYRSRHLPIDNIVQDWFYWKEHEWGSHEFDPARFPDPQRWIDTIHNKYHARLMISVWGKFYPGTQNYDALHSRGFLYEAPLWEGLRDWVGDAYTYYDAFNPAARKLFWSQMQHDLFSKGIDAWWMDATEPDLTTFPDLNLLKLRMNPTALGVSTRVLNAFPLMNSRAVYEGQRAAAPNQRVFILTRCGFAGQQRYAAAVWSGDISSTWEAMRAQMPAGLGYSISGLPYWTMDTGGYALPPRFEPGENEAEDEWNELNARWFEFSTFVPILRLHGEGRPREPWTFGGAYDTILKFDRLRYRMLPYIYSMAGDVTQRAATMMRPMVMDFPQDATARQATDEYMFGPDLLVAPVTEYQVRSRSVYLPAGDWHDFWTGAKVAGGQTIEAPAPYDSIPLYVKAGSILPLGPDLQYTDEKPADPITLHVYPGANGAFTLYEDDGLTYRYERGGFTRIPIRWEDATRTLTIGERQGSFRGMLKRRTFEIAVVPEKTTQTIHYRGNAVEVRL
ncbi:MAG TPA: TIM-barrel domain-containing protein [Verrucomicrobiae bacterium]|nr:TIM-barrel domain-containing protein [Verrucomicrobiae bacterium]